MKLLDNNLYFAIRDISEQYILTSAIIDARYSGQKVLLLSESFEYSVKKDSLDEEAKKYLHNRFNICC